jgi:hypothetical protein
VLDLQAIQARAQARLHLAMDSATPANPANAANEPVADIGPISQLAALATIARRDPGRYALTQAEADAAHAEPRDDSACGRFAARVTMFLRRGINATDADDLAERLHLRDVQGDDRRLCMECLHLAGRAATGWRCGNARAAGVGRDLPAALVALPQRCRGFSE